MDRNIAPPRPTVDQLRHVANKYPIIDHHAHNLILPTHSDTIPFETITTEAQGRALRDTFKSLSHLRAAKQLRQLYDCGEDADWEDIQEQRVEWLRTNPERFHQQCFEGVHALLIDDGLGGPEKVYPFDHHDRYTKASSKRIVRIESVAERLMHSLLRKADEDDLADTKFLPKIWVKFTDEFERDIQEAMADPDVAAFKTVIGYRTGLDIEPDYEEAARAVGHPFERYVKSCIRKRSYRIEKKAVNDYIVLRTLEILSDQTPHSDSLSKPLQFHTGVGDNDIKLVESNPAFLQQLIENYPTVPLVLLNSAYPFTREAGYLATVYRHVYLDIGEVFPTASRDGQKAVIRQAMELAPGCKLLYSSGGHWFPETFYLANIQFREVWLEVLLEMVQMGDITPHQGIGMTKDILFNNANVLYDLHYEAVFDETIQEAPRQLTYNPRPDAASPIHGPVRPPPGRTPDPTERTPTFDTPATRSVSPFTPATFPPPPTVPQVYDMHLFDQFKQANPKVKFVYVQWLDYLGAVRTRIVPLKEFERMVREGERIEVPQDDTGMVQIDTSAPIIDSQIYLEPDLRSLRRTQSKDSLPAATVFSYWRTEDGHALPSCPRNNLETLINSLQYHYATTLLVGFEIGVTFFSRRSSDSTNPYRSLTETYPTKNWLQLPFFTDIILALEETDIEIQQYHAGAGNGHYTFVFAPQPPLLAIDSLTQARQIIAQVAAQHNLEATLHPQPSTGIRTITRATISLHPPDRDMHFFLGGILPHLPAITAFTKPSEASYNPTAADTWVAWSTHNTSTPLTHSKPGRWALRCFDSSANPYFALCAIIAAGLLGLSSTSPDTQFATLDVPYDVKAMDEQTRAQYGVVQRMPGSHVEAVEALKGDGALGEALGEVLVQQFVRVSEGERRREVVERY